MRHGSREVIVVGAGITGASTTFHLTQEGFAATLLERESPASGPTGRSSAIVHAFYLLAELSQLARRGTEMLRHLGELTGCGDAGFRQVGMLWVVGAGAANEWTNAVERIRGEGAEIEALTPNQVADLASRFDLKDVALGVWEPTCGYADPSLSTQSLVDGARAGGAEVLLDTPVRRLLTHGDRIIGVETFGGDEILADTVVVAAGPWTRALVGQTGVDLPLHVERHAMAVIDAPESARRILPFAWCDDILTNYARPDGDDIILVGTWAGGGTGHRHDVGEPPGHVLSPDHYETEVSLEESTAIAGTITPRIPDVADLGMRRGYAGLYDMSPDDLPIVDWVPGVQGLFVAAGTSGHGFKLGPAMGQEIAKAVSAGKSSLLDPFRADRYFPNNPS